MAHVTKKQQWDNACGAACLLCAALEAGKTNYPPIGLETETSTLQNNNTSETLLYYISSGVAAAGKHVSQADNAAGYSMPSNLIKAAFHIGFTAATLYMRSTLSVAILKHVYDAEVRKCRTMAGVTVNDGKAPAISTLAATAYKFVVVEPMLVSLHYVLHRPDGSYMDPATGQDLVKMPKLYNRSGLSIVIS